MAMAKTRIQVICRVRPAAPAERADVVEVADQCAVRLIAPGAGPQAKTATNLFHFSRVHGPDATQDDLYRSVLDVVAKADEGASVVLFAFGVSGSGKTHTMQGGQHDQAGLIPRIVTRSFEVNNAVSAMSYYELYQDKVYDLLDAVPQSTSTRAHPPALDIREDAQGKVFVANLSQTSIDSVADFAHHYAVGGSRRHVSSTNLNQASSRSHAIVELHLANGGRITLCDLAGSENNKRTGNEHSKERMRESSDINLSLHCLQSCVKALNKGDARVPYRDSKLTRILSDALGGNAVGMLITCIAPEAKFFADTKNSLAFASLSRNVESRPSTIPEAAPRALFRPRITTALATVATEKARSSFPLAPRLLKAASSSHHRSSDPTPSNAVVPAMTAAELDAVIQRRVSELFHAKVAADGAKSSPSKKRRREPSHDEESETKRLKKENEELWKRLERLERLVAPLPAGRSAAGDLAVTPNAAAADDTFDSTFSSSLPTSSIFALPPPSTGGSSNGGAAGRLPLRVSRITNVLRRAGSVSPVKQRGLMLPPGRAIKEA